MLYLLIFLSCGSLSLFSSENAENRACAPVLQQRRQHNPYSWTTPVVKTVNSPIKSGAISNNQGNIPSSRPLN